MDKQIAARLCEHRLREEELDAEFAHLAEERAKLAEFKQLHEQMGLIAAEAAEANRELDRKEAELRPEADAMFRAIQEHVDTEPATA